MYYMRRKSNEQKRCVKKLVQGLLASLRENATLS